MSDPPNFGFENKMVSQNISFNINVGTGLASGKLGEGEVKDIILTNPSTASGILQLYRRGVVLFTLRTFSKFQITIRNSFYDAVSFQVNYFPLTGQAVTPSLISYFFGTVINKTFVDGPQNEVIFDVLSGGVKYPYSINVNATLNSTNTIIISKSSVGTRFSFHSVTLKITTPSTAGTYTYQIVKQLAATSSDVATLAYLSTTLTSTVITFVFSVTNGPITGLSNYYQIYLYQPLYIDEITILAVKTAVINNETYSISGSYYVEVY